MSVKGGGGTPQIRNLFFGENFVRKGGGGVPPLRTKSAKKYLKFSLIRFGKLRDSCSKKIFKETAVCIFCNSSYQETLGQVSCEVTA